MKTNEMKTNETQRIEMKTNETQRNETKRKVTKRNETKIKFNLLFKVLGAMKSTLY